MSDEAKVALRWIAMPFATIVGAAIAYIFLITISSWSLSRMAMMNPHGDTFLFLQKYVLSLIAIGFSGYAYSSICYNVTPSNKKIASVVMLTIISCVFVGVNAFGISTDAAFTSIAHSILMSVIMVASGIITIAQLDKEETPHE